MITIIYYTQYQRYIVRMTEGSVAEERPFMVRFRNCGQTGVSLVATQSGLRVHVKKKIKYHTSILYV